MIIFKFPNHEEIAIKFSNFLKLYISTNQSKFI